MTSPAPIVLFAYHRPGHTRQTLEALQSNEGADRSELFIYCDGPKPDADPTMLENIRQTREIAKSRAWCGKVHVIESEENKGLAASIRGGVTELIERFGRVIVLEDDIVTSPGFLTFMNTALDKYEKDDRIMHIGGYVPETKGIRPRAPFFSRFMSCWGWATWKRAWDKAIWDEHQLYETLHADPDLLHHFNLDGYIAFDEQLKANMDGRIRTWAIKWFTSVYLEKGLCLYPSRSMARNIGLDGSGDNYTVSRALTASPEYVEHLLNAQPLGDIPVKESRIGRYYLKKFYRFGKRMNFAREVYFLLKTTYEGLAHRHI